MPARRAYERNVPAMTHGLGHEYPRIAGQAKREKAEMRWGDEMRLRRDYVARRSFAPRGETPVMRATSQRFSRDIIAAIANTGTLSFMVFKDNFAAAVFVEFLTRYRGKDPADRGRASHALIGHREALR